MGQGHSESGQGLVAAHLEAKDGKDGLGVHEALVAKVVEATGREDLGASLEPDGLAKGHALLGEDLGEDAAEGAEHGPARVDHLGLTVRREGLGVGGEARGVLQRMCLLRIGVTVTA